MENKTKPQIERPRRRPPMIDDYVSFCYKLMDKYPRIDHISLVSERPPVKRIYFRRGMIDPEDRVSLEITLNKF